MPILEERDHWAPAAQAAGLPRPVGTTAPEPAPGLGAAPVPVGIYTPPHGGTAQPFSPGTFNETQPIHKTLAKILHFLHASPIRDTKHAEVVNIL